jgi:hemerythrin-like domain-containing protein
MRADLQRLYRKNDVALANTARAYLEFWQGDLSILFRKEEEVLLPVLARHAGSLEEPVMQMLVQHASVRGLVMQLSDEAVRGEVRRETLRRLGGRPEDHVRLEDHVGLPLIEETLPSCLDKLLPS